MCYQACEHCSELNQEFRIRSLRDLEGAIQVIAGNLFDGTIGESDYLPKGVLNCCDSGSFSELANDMPWGYFVDY